MTAAMVVSDPVPAVVGTAMNGGMRRRTFRSPASEERLLFGLGRVHRRAAADDEEAVAAVDAVLFGDFFDRFDRGVRLNGGKDGEQNILHIQNLLQAAEVLVRALAAACDDKGTAQAVLTQNVRHAKKAPVSRIDFRRPPGEQARTRAEAALECAAGK